jgi:hypothetical protein
MQKLAGSIQARKAMDWSCKKKYPKDGSLLNMLERYQFRLPTSSIFLLSSLVGDRPMGRFG